MMVITPAKYLDQSPKNIDVMRSFLGGKNAFAIQIIDKGESALTVSVAGPKDGGMFHRDFESVTKDTGILNGSGEKYIQLQAGYAKTKSWIREALRRFAIVNGGSLPDLVFERSTGANPSDELTIITGPNAEARYSKRDIIGNTNRQYTPPQNSTRNSTSTWDAPEITGFDNLVYKMQDKLIDTKRVIKAITDSVGQIAEDFNVYLQEELFHGRAAKRVSDFESDELKPLMEQMARDGYKMEDVEEYTTPRRSV